MLNNVVRSILETHSMHPFNIKIENSFHSRVSLINSFIELNPSLHCFIICCQICVMMETTTMIRLLEHLKPLLRMKSIYMETDNSDIIYTCANVLQGNIFAVLASFLIKWLPCKFLYFINLSRYVYTGKIAYI